VLGVGGVGSAALDQLARRGLKVWDRPISAGARPGQLAWSHRLIRQAYLNIPITFPCSSGLRVCGLTFRPFGQDAVSRGRRASGGPSRRPRGCRGFWPAAASTVLTSKSFPKNRSRRGFRLRVPLPLVAVFERRAGYLDVEDCVGREAARLAVEQGATLEIGASIRAWKVDGTRRAGRDRPRRFPRDEPRRPRPARGGTLWPVYASRFKSCANRSTGTLRRSGFIHPRWVFRAFSTRPTVAVFTVFPASTARAEGGRAHGRLPVADPLRVDRILDPVRRCESTTVPRRVSPGVNREPLHSHVPVYAKPGRPFRRRSASEHRKSRSPPALSGPVSSSPRCWEGAGRPCAARTKRGWPMLSLMPRSPCMPPARRGEHEAVYCGAFAQAADSDQGIKGNDPFRAGEKLVAKSLAFFGRRSLLAQDFADLVRCWVRVVALGNSLGPIIQVVIVMPSGLHGKRPSGVRSGLEVPSIDDFGRNRPPRQILGRPGNGMSLACGSG